jgi:choline dehydrogenase-like flavoprotein
VASDSASSETFDAIVVGGGIGGSFVAKELAVAGLSVLVVEAGRHYAKGAYPRREVDANSQMYWGGGLELNTTADLVLLRPKVVGGGSVVNQALVDRFDDDALDSWVKASGVGFLARAELDPWYGKAEAEIAMETIPAERRNGNAKVFLAGCEANGFQTAPLRRAQSDCKNHEGNDCIECLAGCPLESKQSMPWTLLRRAAETGRLRIEAELEVTRVTERPDRVEVEGVKVGGLPRTFTARKLVLAAGAIGNSKLLLRSGLRDRLPAAGTGLYVHPQYLNLAVYGHRVEPFKGAFQSLKSADPTFRAGGFKLENVFAPPAGIAMLLRGTGVPHRALMEKLPYMACVEVAVRDTEPGRVEVDRKGNASVHKRLNAEDRARRARGFEAIHKIFGSTGAKEIHDGQFGIGLHLMGGCALGTDPRRSVTGPDFKLHGFRRTWVCDSSLFPNAPGINPSLTVMALALRAAKEVLA